MAVLVLDAKAQALLADILDIEVPTLEEVEVTPTTEAQTINADEGKAFNKVKVKAVTSAIDSDIVPENIKKDVEILGVTGSLE